VAMPTARVTSGKARTDPISDFFATLVQPGRIATFEGESATVRFDVRDGDQTERWHVKVTKGAVSVSRQKGAADAVVRIERSPFEAVVTGRLNAQAAMLRGLLCCEGDVAALMMFQRCLPGPPGSAGRVAPITSATVMAQRRPA
jgi:predicted lipid carrier protein YhbT